MTNDRPRIGNWCQSFTGRQTWPLDPRPEEIDIRDVAHHLAIQNRFAGATLRPYSVAEHSVRVSLYCGCEFLRRHPNVPLRFMTRAALAGLMHDSPEYLLGDVTRPLKRTSTMDGYRYAEQRLAGVMEAWCDLPLGAFDWNIVADGDAALLLTEKRDHIGPPPASWGINQGRPQEPLPGRIDAWTPLGLARWAGVLLPEAIRYGGLRGAVTAVRHLADSGPWPWWYAERRFLARWRELTANARPIAAESLHWHGCPICYEKVPCSMNCAIVADLSEDGVRSGYYHECDNCKKEDARGDE